MKGVFKCIKFLTFSIILALFCVLFSDDTSALTLSMSIEPTGNAWENFQVDCVYSANDTVWVPSTTGSSEWSCNRFPTNTNNYSLNGIRTHNTIHVEEGLYYQGYLILRNPSEGATYPTIYWNFNQSDDFDFVTIEELYDDSIRTKFNTYCSSSSSNFDCYSTEQYDNYYVKMYMLTLRAKSTGDVKWQLGPTGNFVKSLNSNDYVLGLRKIVEYKPSSIESALEEQNQKDDEDRSNLESQQESSSTDAGTSADAANQQGTTLLAAFTSFVNALTSATPSNCRLDMDLGNLDMGNVDLCQLSPPAGFSALASVFMILFCVPLSIATARKVISLFRSFQ